MSLTTLSANSSAAQNNTAPELGRLKKENTSTAHDAKKPVVPLDSKQSKPVELGELHKTESFSGADLEQLKRLAQIKELLAKGAKGDDALTLDLVANLKTNIKADEKNAEIKAQHLDTLKTNIETKNYKEAISGALQMMNLFELESRGAAMPLPAKNTKGAFVSTIIDTIGSYALGDVAGPSIVKLFKFLGSKITPKNLGENPEMAAKTGFGVAGFFGAEEAIKRFLDPMWEKIDHALNHTFESKAPDFLNRINQSAHKIIHSALHNVLGFTGKKTNLDADLATEAKYSEPLKEKLVDYIQNQKEIESKDKWIFSKLVKEMLIEDYRKHYGKEIPKPLKIILDASFTCVSTESPTRNMLISNEGAEALKEPLEKFLKFPGKVLFHFFNDIVPNIYIFAGRPLAMYAVNHKERELVDMANNLGIKITKPSTAAK